jgi:hypothetical protein
VLHLLMGVAALVGDFYNEFRHFSSFRLGLTGVPARPLIAQFNIAACSLEPHIATS